jgi:hypothetical protein
MSFGTLSVTEVRNAGGAIVDEYRMLSGPTGLSGWPNKTLLVGHVTVDPYCPPGFITPMVRPNKVGVMIVYESFAVRLCDKIGVSELSPGTEVRWCQSSLSGEFDWAAVGHLEGCDNRNWYVLDQFKHAVNPHGIDFDHAFRRTVEHLRGRQHFARVNTDFVRGQVANMLTNLVSGNFRKFHCY